MQGPSTTLSVVVRHYAVNLLLAINIILLQPLQPFSMAQSDRVALLAFRDQTRGGSTPPPGGGSSSASSLNSWNGTLHFCLWEGITCSRQRRVTVLSLPSRKLFGSLSPFIGNLTSLQELNLGDNHLQGNIPPELGNLVNLRILNLTGNTLGGNIPVNLSSCTQLVRLDLSMNQLVGQIPIELTTALSKLDLLQLQVNNLTGTIPLPIGNLSSLTTLGLGRNNLHGTIPDSVGAITGLEFLQIAENQISGAIPRSLYNLSSLTFVAIATNRIHGTLPPTLGLSLPKLDTLYVGGNRLTGRIPASISNASGLVNLDFAANNFSGSIPVDLGRLGGLEWLNFEENSLGTGGTNDLDFITSLRNCTNLQVLDIDQNRFGGTLPNSIANLSIQLSMLILSSNQIYGSIPESIENLASLAVMRLEKNSLTGCIPRSVGGLRNLQILSLSQNRISGVTPTTLGNLTQLNNLRLRENDLHGSIPSTLMNCTKLQVLDFSRNKLNGAIPAVVFGISSLSVFLSVAQNSLVGSLPREIGNLKNLGIMDISENRLSGEIPLELGSCESMEYVGMQGNLFVGSIPSTLSNLKGIRYLDLSRNKLSGQVPEFLVRLHSLEHLNLSFNDFEGSPPAGGVFTNASAISVIGNAKLCGGPPTLHLPSCIDRNSKRKGSTKITIPTVCAVAGFSLLLCFFATIYFLRSRKKNPLVTASFKFNEMVSYKDLLQATNGFSSSNLIGEGSYGKVYRGTLDGKAIDVAVKVLNLQNRRAFQSFAAECETLRHVRHRNLVKILTICSSMDYAGNDFKALVYEFMHNGSLDEWLHPTLEKQQHSLDALNIFQRLNISMDVAAALDYLHQQCQTPIVHCDLKPSNILLDQDKNARVGDFGLAKMLVEDMNSPSEGLSAGIRGSIGYIPPEYGVGEEVSTHGDVYSYGILLLEMLTGKRPTDDSFKDGLCLREFVKVSHPEGVMEIIDPRLLSPQDMNADGATRQIEVTNSKKIEECLVSLMEVGLTCSATSPRERMEMKEVVAKMHAIKESLLGE